VLGLLGHDLRLQSVNTGFEGGITALGVFKNEDGGSDENLTALTVGSGTQRASQRTRSRSSLGAPASSPATESESESVSAGQRADEVIE
jgi:hypothetical protein